MKTHDLPRSARHARSHFPLAVHDPRTPLNSARGDWRYPRAPRTGGTLAIGALAALGLHAAMFYGVPEPRPRAARPSATKVESAIQIALPPLPPDEPDDAPRELVDQPAAAIAVPQLAELPTSVALSDFVQTVDLRPHVEADVRALKSMTIPVLRGRGGSGGGEWGGIFNLAQLDRVPEPIAQPMPDFPKNVRIAGVDLVVVEVEFVVDAEGRVQEPRVTSSNAHEFDRAALSGVARWKFRPGILSGRKVATRMSVPLKFDLTAR